MSEGLQGNVPCYSALLEIACGPVLILNLNDKPRVGPLSLVCPNGLRDVRDPACHLVVRGGIYSVGGASLVYPAVGHLLSCTPPFSS